MSDLISREQAIKIVRKIIPDNRANGICEELRKLKSIQPEIVRCKDSKHFEYDYVAKINGIPLIVAHEVCMRWGDGVATSENGYCFLAEKRKVTT